MEENAPLISTLHSWEVINDLEVAIEVADPWRVLYPEARTLVAAESFQLRLREDNTITVTARDCEFDQTELKVMVSEVNVDFCRKVGDWLKQEQQAIREEEKQVKRRERELEERTRSEECRIRIHSKLSFSFMLLGWLVWELHALSFSDALSLMARILCPALLFFCLAWALPNTKRCQLLLLLLACAWALGCFIVVRGLGPFMGIWARHLYLADGYDRREDHEKAKFHAREATILFEGKVIEKLLCIA